MSPKLSQPTHDYCCRGCEDTKLSRLLDGLIEAHERGAWDPVNRVMCYRSRLDSADAESWWLAVQFRAETLKTGRRPDNWHPNG